MHRRRFVAAAGAFCSAAAGGCLDGASNDADEASGPDSDDAGMTSPTATAEASEGDAASAWPTEPYADYDVTRVRVETPDGERLGAVRAAIAQTDDQRWLGLSDAESMPDDGGMLFVFGAVADRTFVMRRMDFGLDMLFADADGAITEIHHAPAPGPNEDGDEQRYPGRGKYVLEVNYGWATERGVETGDVLAFQL